MLCVENFYASNYHLWFQECTSYVIFLLKWFRTISFCYSWENVLWRKYHYKWCILQSYVFFERSECFHIYIQDFRCERTDKIISFSHDYKYNFWNTKLLIYITISCNYRSFPQVGIDQNELLLMSHHEHWRWYIYCYLLGCPLVFTAAHEDCSSSSKRGLPSSCSGWASHCSGFSCGHRLWSVWVSVISGI